MKTVLMILAAVLVGASSSAQADSRVVREVVNLMVNASYDLYTNRSGAEGEKIACARVGKLNGLRIASLEAVSSTSHPRSRPSAAYRALSDLECGVYQYLAVCDAEYRADAARCRRDSPNLRLPEIKNLRDMNRYEGVISNLAEQVLRAVR